MSIRDKLLGQKPLTKEVQIAGWDFPVRIQEMNVGRRQAFIEAMDENIRQVAAYKAYLKAVENYVGPPEGAPKPVKFVEEIDEVLVGVIHSIVDENDELVFKLSDITEMKAMPYKALQSIYLETLQMGLHQNVIAEVESEKKD